MHSQRGAGGAWWGRVLPKRSSRCRPGTGAASRDCQAPTGATASSMNRCRTPVSARPLEDPLEVLPSRAEGRCCAPALTCGFVVAGAGFEPATFGL